MDAINQAWDDAEKMDKNAEALAVISGAQTFAELIDGLDGLGRVTKPDGTVYSADELVEAITAVRNGERFISSVTRTHGLREKVAALYAAEQIANATSIEDLCQKIDVIVATFGEPLKSSSGTPMDTGELKAAIRLVAGQGVASTMVTRQYGLREKVEALARA